MSWGLSRRSRWSCWTVERSIELSVDPDRDAARTLLDRMYSSGDWAVRLSEANERARKAEKDRDEIRAVLSEVLGSPLHLIRYLVSTPQMKVPTTLREAIQEDLRVRAERLAGLEVE